MNSSLFSDRSLTWPTDVSWLRDEYESIRDAWEQSGSDPAADEQLYKATEPKLNDLIGGLTNCISQIPDRKSLTQEIQIAGSGQMTARAAAGTGNWAQATTYQAHALVKLRSILDTLTRIASKNVHQFISRLAKKAAIPPHVVLAEDWMIYIEVNGLMLAYDTEMWPEWSKFNWQTDSSAVLVPYLANHQPELLKNEAGGNMTYDEFQQEVGPISGTDAVLDHQKLGYGYNQDGVVNEPGSNNPQHDSGTGNERNPEAGDTHPENMISDGEALKEFPELAVSYNHRPTRPY